MMNLGHLAVFYAVAEEGNVSRGAERLHISQPAVSKQLRELERSLGMALFHRLSKGVQLTEAGEVLLDYARQIFELEKDAGRAMQQLRSLQRGSIRIGASQTIGNYLMPRLCTAFQQKYPGIELTLEVDNSEVTRRNILNGRLDVAFVEGTVEDDESVLQSEVFASDELVAIVAPHHPLAGQRSILLCDLYGEPLILREPGSGTRAIVEEVLRDKGATLHSIMSLNSPEAIKRAVADGAGVAFISTLAIENEVRNGQLHVLKIEDLHIQRPLHRIKRLGKYESRAVREFWKLMRQMLEIT